MSASDQRPSVLRLAFQHIPTGVISTCPCFKHTTSFVQLIFHNRRLSFLGLYNVLFIESVLFACNPNFSNTLPEMNLLKPALAPRKNTGAIITIY